MYSCIDDKQCKRYDNKSNLCVVSWPKRYDNNSNLCAVSWPTGSSNVFLMNSQMS